MSDTDNNSNILDRLDKIESKPNDIKDNNLPNTLPPVPTVKAKGSFAIISLEWTYENKAYYTYEVYASKIENFNPTFSNLIFKGQASSFLHEVKPQETWYYRVRAVNTHNESTPMSNQVSASTFKIADGTEYFESAAISDALIGTLRLDRGWFGQLKGNYIDAKQLSVTDGNGKRTLWIDSFGNVQLDVTSFKILSKVAATQEYVDNGYKQGIVEVIPEGVKVSHTDIGTKTVMGADGFYIEDSNGETIASLASKEAWTELKADKVFANNIQTIYQGDGNLYVDHSKTVAGTGTASAPFNNFYDLAQYLMRTPILNKDITVNVLSTGTISDSLDIRGLHGRGTLKILMNKTLVINYDNVSDNAFYFYDCYLKITIDGGRTSYNSADGALINGFPCGIRFNKCKWGYISNVAINTKSYAALFISTNGQVHKCDLCDTPTGIYANENSLIYDTGSTCGNCTYSFYSLGGSLIQVGGESNGYKPIGSYRRVSGNIIEFGTGSINQTASKRIPPQTPATQTYISTFKYTRLATYQYAWSNWASGEWGNRAIQGVYSSYGNKSGHIFFDISSIRSFLGSGTVQSGCTITLTRRNGGGSSYATNIYICASTCSSASGTPSYSGVNTLLGTLAWNETKTFTLPTSIVNALKSGYSSLACYSTSNTSAYAEIVSASITLKVNK